MTTTPTELVAALHEAADLITSCGSGDEADRAYFAARLAFYGADDVENATEETRAAWRRCVEAFRDRLNTDRGPVVGLVTFSDGSRYGGAV